MSYEIVWLPQAEFTFISVLDYLEQEWTSREIKSFIDRVEEVLNFLSKNPRQYLYSKRKDIFRAVVTRQVSLYYRINGEKIELLTFWDNRQNPSKLQV